MLEPPARRGLPLQKATIHMLCSSLVPLSRQQASTLESHRPAGPDSQAATLHIEPDNSLHVIPRQNCTCSIWKLLGAVRVASLMLFRRPWNTAYVGNLLCPSAASASCVFWNS